MEAMARKEGVPFSSMEKESEVSPSRWQLRSKAEPEAAAEGDDACGASELSTHAMSSPGVAQLSTPSEGDDSGGLVAMVVAGTGAPDSTVGQQPLWRLQGTGAAASSAPCSPTKGVAQQPGIGQKMWRAVGGDDVLTGRGGRAPDARTVGVLKNLKNLLSNDTFWQLRHSGDKQVKVASAQPNQNNNLANAATAADRAAGGGGSPCRPMHEVTPLAAASPNSLAVSSLSSSPSKAPNFAEAAVEALAAAKRAEASRLVVERLAEERLAAERILAERLQMEDVAAERLSTERLEGERLSVERMAVAAENERVLNERLQRCEAREALCEQQVAAEQGRAVLLRAELEAARRELECRDKEAKLAEELKAREVHIAAKTQCLESMHEDAQREIEALRLQHHVAEVDLGRSRSELATTTARQKVLEEEIRLLKERPPKALKPGAQKRAAGGKLLDRYELASRTAFAAQASVGEVVHEAKVLHNQSAAEAQGGSSVHPEKKQSSWLFWGCCSTTKASPNVAVNAAAPEFPSNKPQA